MPMYKIGDVVKGKVTGIEKYGIFLLMNDGYTGLIHISEISEKFVKNVYDYVQLNEVILSKVIEVDEENQRLKLTIKNFDYRNDDKKGHEDKDGFLLLKEKLPIWIAEYKEKTEK